MPRRTMQADTFTGQVNAFAMQADTFTVQVNAFTMQADTLTILTLVIAS
ncbi:MAG: hypothetical protein V7L29_19160 [Nostoc sp.]